MARAKRTNRAEARRRHRASFAEPPVDGELMTDDAAEDAPGAPAGARPAPARAAAGGAAASGAAAPPPRPGIAAAFRSSFRPVDVRGDLRALPRLLMTRAFLIPVVLAGASFILYVMVPNATTYVLYTYLAAPPVPIGAVFVAGFFASRAGWLIGGLVAVAAMLLQLPWLAASQPPIIVLNALVGALMFGALFAAMAAWYRRFLYAANPNRRTRRPAPPTGRRPDGRQPRKNQQRPMLARRR